MTSVAFTQMKDGSAQDYGLLHRLERRYVAELADLFARSPFDPATGCL